MKQRSSELRFEIIRKRSSLSCHVLAPLVSLIYPVGAFGMA